MSPAFMPTTPTGRYRSMVDLMDQIDRAQFDEAQKQGARRERLWDVAMPSIERLSEYYDKTLQGGWSDTPIGRAATASVMRSTSNLKKRIRETMAARGMSGQPAETTALVDAELSGGQALNQLPLSQIPAAESFAGGTLPSLAAASAPQFPRVQTGAMQYLGQVLPYNLQLENMYDKWANLIGRGQGAQDVYRRKPTSGIEELFNAVRN